MWITAVSPAWLQWKDKVESVQLLLSVQDPNERLLWSYGAFAPLWKLSFKIALLLVLTTERQLKTHMSCSSIENLNQWDEGMVASWSMPGLFSWQPAGHMQNFGLVYAFSFHMVLSLGHDRFLFEVCACQMSPVVHLNPSSSLKAFSMSILLWFIMTQEIRYAGYLLDGFKAMQN